MLKYTVASLTIIKKEIDFIAHIVNILTASVMMAYLLYNSVTDKGYLAVNIILLLATAGNFVTYIVTRRAESKRSRTVKKSVKHAYNITKISLNAFSLISVVYTIYVNSSSVSAMTLVTAPLLIILWVVQVIFELISLYTGSRITLFLNGLQMDFEPLVESTFKAKNVLHDIFGEEREERTPISERNRAALAGTASVAEEAKRQKWSKRLNYLLSKRRKKSEPEAEESRELAAVRKSNS